jgi:ankyrin
MTPEELISLCRKGDVNQVRQAIAEQVPLNVFVDGVSPLMAAIDEDNSEIVSALIHDPSDYDPCYDEPIDTDGLIRHAIKKAALKSLEVICDAWLDVVSLEDVLFAASLGSEPIVKCLLGVYYPMEASHILYELQDYLSPDTIAEHRPIVDTIVGACAGSIDAYDECYQLSPFVAAVKGSDSYLVSAYIKAKSGENPSWMNYAPKGVDPALHHAVRANDAAIVSMMLAAGADPNACGESNRTPLFFATDIGIATSLLDARADVNHREVIRYEQRYTPLRTAPSGAITELLINRNADIGLANPDSRMLSCHVLDQSYESLKYLLTVHDWSMKDKSNALLSAVQRSPSPTNIQIIKVLIDAGADVSSKDNRFCPLHYARDGAVAQLLLESRADHSLLSYYGHTPLHHHCLNDCVEQVVTLLKYGADVHARTPEGETALHVAVGSRKADIAQILLGQTDSASFVNEIDGNGQDSVIQPQQRANIHAVDRSGLTPLMHACKRGHRGCVALLLEHRADIRSRSDTRDTALILALKWRFTDIDLVSMLLSDPRATPAWVNASTTDGHTALSTAINDKASIPFISTLLDAGADLRKAQLVRQRRGDASERLLASALTLAIAEDHVDLLRRVLDAHRSYLEQKGRPLLTTSELNTALHTVVTGDLCVEMASALIHAGADPNMRIEDGNSLLYYLYKPDMIKVLVNNGADVNAVSIRGYTALHVACKLGDAETAQTLLSCGADAMICTRHSRLSVLHEVISSSYCLPTYGFLPTSDDYDSEHSRSIQYSRRVKATNKNFNECLNIIIQHILYHVHLEEPDAKRRRTKPV